MRRANADTLVLGLAYASLGLLSLMLALPKGYATPLFAPAGLALSMALIMGRRALPGIALGSFLMNLWVGYSSAGGLGSTFGVAAGLALASVLQAWVGRSLVLWKVPDILNLRQAQDSVFMLLLGGPLACLVAATLGCLVLRTFGAISPWQGFQTWWTWWVGDTIGVFIMAPLVLLFRPGANLAWRRRRLPVLGALALSLALVSLSVTKISHQQTSSAAADFARRSQSLAQALHERLYGYEEYLNAVKHYVQATPDVDGASFRDFVEDLYVHYPGIRAMSWVPAVDAEERATFERHASQVLHSPFSIQELDPEGRLRTASARSRYFPVLLIEPRGDNKGAIGLDLASETDRRLTLQKAIEAGKMRASDRLHLVQLPQGKGGVLIAQPVFGPDGHLRGLVTGVFSLAQLAEALEGASALGISATLRDPTAAGKDTVLIQGEAPAPSSASGGLRQSLDLEWGGRHYRLETLPTAAFLAGMNNWGIWLMMASGLLLASLMEGFILALPSLPSDGDMVSRAEGAQGRP